MQARLSERAAELSQLTGEYLPAVLSAAAEGPCIIAGVGMCAMLAHDLATQLQCQGCEVKLLLVAASVPVSLAERALGATQVPHELLQVWCALFQLIISAPRSQPFSQPPLAEVIRKLRSLQSYEQQLDYVSTFCPADRTALAWDTEVDLVLSRVLHMRQLLLAHQPRGTAKQPHTVVLQLGDGSKHAEAMQPADVQSIADDSWESMAPGLLPATACSIAAGSSRAAAAASLEGLLGCLL